MQLDTIVIGMDFSPAAVTTATWVATELAPRATIVLVHAIDHPARPSFLVAETLPAEALAADARTAAEERLHEVAPAIRHGALRTEIRMGRADDVIAQVAMETAADLIAVGPHGNREHESMLLGTTADSLVRRAPAPVLIGPRAPLHRMEGVVAAVEDSPVTAEVFAWADLLAKQLSARLTVLHVLDDASYSHMASVAAAHAHGSEDAEREELQAEWRTQTLQWLQQCAAAGVDPSNVDVQVEHGPAAEGILQVAKHDRSAVIVLGRHGAVRGVPALLGRTVRHVLHAARCAVMVVPPSADAEGA
jgi:nucleotide-binding universal stress UspA family protein